MARSKTGKRNYHRMVDREELLPGGSDAEFRQFIYDTIAFTARMKTVIDGHARIVGLPSPQYMILASVAHLSGKQDVSIKTVADHLHVTGSFVSNNAGKLERLGLIEKTVSDSDRRQVHLTVTDAARERFSRLAGVQNKVNNVMFEPLTRAEFVSLCKVMPRLLASADRSVVFLSHLEAEAKSRA